MDWEAHLAWPTGSQHLHYYCLCTYVQCNRHRNPTSHILPACFLGFLADNDISSQRISPSQRVFFFNKFIGCNPSRPILIEGFAGPHGESQWRDRGGETVDE